MLLRRHSLEILAAAILATLGFAAPSHAQKRSDASPPVQALSPQTQEAIQKLGTLTSLPADGWRIHVGDLAHGESTDLDDSSWPMAVKDSADNNDAVWYRHTAEVPKNLNG